MHMTKSGLKIESMPMSKIFIDQSIVSPNIAEPQELKTFPTLGKTTDCSMMILIIGNDSV